MTRMPTRLHPRPGETLHGYAARFSKTLDMPLGAILDGLGLLPGERRGWGCLLTRAQAGEVGDALGLPPEQVRALTLQSYEPMLTMPTEAQRRSLGGWAAGEWVFLRGGRYCPVDLREQLPWHLSWRLPEQIGCLRHDVLLAHLCPGCGGPVSAGGGERAEVGFLDFVHDPQRCFSPARTERRRTGRAAVPCGHDLTGTAVRSLTTRERNFAGLVARMHAGQDVLLLGESAPPWVARQVLREALSLQAGADQREQTSSASRTRLYRQPISDPGRVSDLLERTGDWLFATDLAAADKALTNWIGNISSNATPNWALFARSLGTAPALEPYLRRSLRHFGRPSLRASRQRSHQMPEATPYLERLPQLAWACALPQDLRLSTEPAVPFLQVAFSMQLARQSTTSWARAAALLALPSEAPGWVKYVYGRLQRKGLRDRFVEQVQSVHEQLLGQPSWRSHANPAPHLRLPPLTEGLCMRQGAPWCPCLGELDDLRLSGDPFRPHQVPPPRKNSTGRTCQASTPRCENDHYGRGVCHAHHMRAYRNPALWDTPLEQWLSLDEPARSPAPPKLPQPCQASIDCGKPAKARKVCSAHYEAARHNPSLWTMPLGSWPLPAKRVGPCQAGPADAPCGRAHRSHGVCNGHYQRAQQDPTLWTLPLEQWPPLPRHDRSTGPVPGTGSQDVIKAEGDELGQLTAYDPADTQRFQEESP